MSRKKTPKQSKAALHASATLPGGKRRTGLFLIAVLATALVCTLAFCLCGIDGTLPID